MKILKHIYSQNGSVSMASFLIKSRFILSAFLMLTVLLCTVNLSFAQEDTEDDEFTQGDETSEQKQSSEDPFELFNKAQDAHSKGDLEKALKLYDEAVKAMPEFPEAEFQRGSIFQSLGKTADAEKAFRRAIELRRDWTLPIAELGALLVQKGEYVEAEQQLEKAIRLNEMSFPAYIALTELKIKTGASAEELKSLLGKLQYLTTKSKIPASVWASRGAVERTLGDLEAAKTSIKRALDIDAQNSFAIAESIKLSIKSGDTKGAVNNAKRLSELFPHSLNAKLIHARSLYADGQTSEAIKVLDAIENPTDEVVQLKSVYTDNENLSVESLEQMLEKDGDNPSILGHLCILSRTDNPQKALEYCQKASALQPTEINHAIGFGAALVKLKRYTEAVGLFQKLLENSPENYTIRANLATALFQLERFGEAKNEYQWIIKKQPDLAVAYYFLAISHDRLEEYLDAMANYQQFLRLADDSLKLEIEKVNLRLPTLQTQIKNGKGKK